MKKSGKYIILIVVSFSVLVVSVMCFTLVNKKSAPVTYAAEIVPQSTVPEGYVLVQNGVEYGEGNIYIDTSVTPNLSSNNHVYNIEAEWEYVYISRIRVSANYIWLIGDGGDYESDFYGKTSGWNSNMVSELNNLYVSSLSSSNTSYVNTWLYFKEYVNAPEPITEPLSITFDSGVESVSYGDTVWTESGQAHSITFDKSEDDSYLFDVTYKDRYILDDFSYDAGANVFADYNQDDDLVFTVPVGEGISSIDITTEYEPYQEGYIIQRAPYFTGNAYDGFTVAGYNNTKGLIVPGGTVFENFESVVDYFNSNYTDYRPAGNIVRVLDSDYNPVIYPFVIDGQTLYLEYSSYYSSVAIVGGISNIGYSQFGNYTNNPNNPVSADGYVYMPQFPSQNPERRIYFRHSDIIYGEPTKYARLVFDDTFYEVPIEWNINEWAYWITLPDELPYDYYLNTVAFTGGLLVFNFSNIPGAFGWSPGVDDALDLFSTIVDGVLDALNIQIATNITLGSILLVVLAFGVILFLFRISGVF